MNSWTFRRPFDWKPAPVFPFSSASSPQTITPDGIPSSETFGTLTIQLGAVTIIPDGIATTEAFGTLQVNLKCNPDGIATSEAFGTVTVTPGPVTITPTGIATTEAFGTVTVTVGALSIFPDGIASTEAFGTPQVNLKVFPSGIASAEAFGTLTASAGMLYMLSAENAPSKAAIADHNFGLWDTHVLRGTATLDFPNVLAQSTQDLTIAVAGAEIGDAAIICAPAAASAGIVYQAWVSAAGTVKVRATNVTAGGINPASATFQVIVLKS